MRALVIDDSKPIRSILAKMLREMSFDTTEAANGEEGLQLLQQLGRPDLATVNWQMPKMDGLQFLREVRGNARFRQLPMLMISSESEPAKIATAMAAGANGYIVKPCTRQALRENLARLGVFSAKPATGALPQTTGQPGDEPRKIRVLIVDDSVVVRRAVSNALQNDPDLDIAGTAADGQIALDRLESTDPDVVLLDVEMPNLNGLETLKRLRKIRPFLPVIMFSSLTERGAAVTTEALLSGAADYVPKPGGTHMKDVEAGKRAIREELIPKIKQLSLYRGTRGRMASEVVANTFAADAARLQPRARSANRVNIVVLALSTGGPCALARLLPTFASACPVPILIVQHMPPIFTKHLAQRLAAGGQLDVREAEEGECVEPGRIRIAPGGFHLVVSGPASRARLRLNEDPYVNGCRPSADVLLRSVADVYEGEVLAVVMTGMGSDGLVGCKYLWQRGGQILAQDEATSVVWGMPGQVARAGLADQVLPLDELGPAIARRVCTER